MLNKAATLIFPLSMHINIIIACGISALTRPPEGFPVKVPLQIRKLLEDATQYNI